MRRRPHLAMDKGTRRIVTDSVLRLALDKGTTRKFDADGQMHISIANISKANICPYKGEEIPDYELLGLERKKSTRCFAIRANLKRLRRPLTASNCSRNTSRS